VSAFNPPSDDEIHSFQPAQVIGKHDRLESETTDLVDDRTIHSGREKGGGNETENACKLYTAVIEGYCLWGD